MSPRPPKTLQKVHSFLKPKRNYNDGCSFLWNPVARTIGSAVASSEICIPVFAWSTKLWETESGGFVLGTRSCHLRGFYLSAGLKGESSLGQSPRDVGSLFRPGSRREEYRFGVCVPRGSQQRLLGSYKSVLLLSRAEFIRLDPPGPPLVKKEADLSGLPEFQTILSYLSSV